MSKVHRAQVNGKQKKEEDNCIMSDSDFETKNLDDMEIKKLDAMEDKRVSPFWKMSWGEVAVRFALWAILVFLHEFNYMNPHEDNFIFSDLVKASYKKWSD